MTPAQAEAMIRLEEAIGMCVELWPGDETLGRAFVGQWRVICSLDFTDPPVDEDGDPVTRFFSLGPPAQPIHATVGLLQIELKRMLD